MECKRLGNPGRRNFNHQYVDEGIVRFVSRSHKYGVHGASGAMVGYVQCSDNPTILSQVQPRVSHRNLGPIRVHAGLDEAIAELRQELVRKFGASPFRLHHFWVDVR